MGRIFPVLLVGFLAGLGGCASVPSHDLRAASDGIPAATPMPQSTVEGRAPSGFIAFCLRNADQCALPDNQAVTAQLTPANWVLLNDVNRAANAAIQPKEDLEHYGRADYWTIATDGYGDCEDFALTKRKTLIDAGLPVAALRIAVVLTGRGERHAILTVATDRGDFVLDSLSDRVRPWTATDYVWLERQDPGRSWGWDMLLAEDARPMPTAAMAR